MKKKEKQAKQIVVYNSIGEKKIMNRDINVSKMVTFRQMFINMRSRDERARAATREAWDEMLGINKHSKNILDGGDTTKLGLSCIPPVRWHLIPLTTQQLFADYGRSLLTGVVQNTSATQMTHWPWPVLPEIFVKLHELQLKTLPLKDRDQFELPTFQTVLTLPLHIVLELIREILDGKEADDMVQDRQGHPRGLGQIHKGKC